MRGNNRANPKHTPAPVPKDPRPISQVTCFHCQKLGHYAHTCKGAWAPKSNRKTIQLTQKSALTTVTAVVNSSSEQSTSIDSTSILTAGSKAAHSPLNPENSVLIESLDSTLCSLDSTLDYSDASSDSTSSKSTPSNSSTFISSTSNCSSSNSSSSECSLADRSLSYSSAPESSNESISSTPSTFIISPSSSPATSPCIVIARNSRNYPVLLS